jgi:type III pantothenate kinase
MIRPPVYDPSAPIVVIDIGNSTIGVATWHQARIKSVVSHPTSDQPGFEQAFAAHRESAPRGRLAAAVISSVVPEALERVRTFLAHAMDLEPLVVGDTIPFPMDIDLSDKKSVGADRVCQAAAAYERIQRGCTVVSFGTAVTVDLVDDDGDFVGGAILPGLGLQLRVLHEHTAKLPLVEPGFPELPYGRNTTEAIQNGVCRGLTGAVRAVVEAYATYLNRWPQVVATGGDAAFFAPHCDFLDNVVSDLALRGVGLAYDKHLSDMGA